MCWEENTQLIVVPGSNDVLTGRGKRAFEHSGNKILRVEIANHLDKYRECATRADKSRLIRTLVQRVLDRGGKFLKRTNKTTNYKDPFVYCLAGFKEARMKISHALRDAGSDKVKCMRLMMDSKDQSKSLYSDSEESAASENEESLFKQKNALKSTAAMQVSQAQPQFRTMYVPDLSLSSNREAKKVLNQSDVEICKGPMPNMPFTVLGKSIMLDSFDTSFNIMAATGNSDSSLDSACLDAFNESSLTEMGFEFDDFTNTASSVEDLFNMALNVGRAT